MQILPKKEQVESVEPPDKLSNKSAQKPKSTKKIKEKIGSRSIEDGHKKKRGNPIEDFMHLVCMLRIGLEGRQIGAYVLRKGEQAFQIKFGFECKGIHSTLRAEQIDPIFDILEAGIKDFPPQEILTIHLASFTSDVERQQQLSDLIKTAPSQELQFLIMGEKQRIRELNEQGIRKPKTLRFYVSYTVEPDVDSNSDFIEQTLSRLERHWKSFTGELDKFQFTRIENLILQAYKDGFQRWEQLLSNKLGFDIRPLSEQELWSTLWSRFNSSPAIEVPQTLILTEEGLTEEIKSDLSPTTLLLNESVPVADRQWVHVNGKYVGALAFVDKPGGWAGKESQMRYLWEVMAREKVYDTEVFCQLSRANESLLKTNMQRLTKQANTATAVAADSGSIDVKSELNIRKGVEAQEALYEGAVPFYTAITFLIHRDTLPSLDDACRFFTSLFLRPAWVAREVEYPWRLWLQTLPTSWEKLLSKPFERRQIYLSSEVLGLTPIVKPRTIDNQGLELIAAEGGTPIFLDLFTTHRNLCLFGTTRSGKSVLASGILTQALAYGIPVVAMDYPKPDGTSTFTDYTLFMGERGAYFNVANESCNMFELPDLSQLNAQQQKERFEDYKDFLVSALLTMIVGSGGRDSSQERSIADLIRSVLTLAIEAFFKDDLIIDRYAQAFTSGFGTELWQTMPTLRDFIGYCSYERLTISTPSDELKNVMQQIKLKLQFWLTSRIGKSISRPSTFRSDAQLLIFALANLSNDEDAAVLSLSAYSAALRRALANPVSIFFIDESPILFQYDAISDLVARLCANGAKAGVRVILSGQEPNSIAQSSGGAKIFANMTSRLVGRIQPTAVDAFIEILKYPREIIARNSTESFFPRKESIYSQWLIDDLGAFTQVRFYPSYQLLAAVVNNPNEQAARTAAMSKYPNKLIGLNEFSKQLVSAIRSS